MPIAVDSTAFIRHDYTLTITEKEFEQMRKTIIFTGFMLFSLFFGAGNLIFPPSVGFFSGDAFTPAILGFTITAILLPLAAVVATIISKDGLLSITKQVGPVFGVLFAVLLYMSIGPFYAIPRAANIGYKFGWAPIIGESGLHLLIFSVIFFLATYFVSIRPQKLVDIVGKLLTPALLITLTILFIQAVRTFTYTSKPAGEKFAEHPFLVGFLEGYFTLDAIAALAFGIVVIESLKLAGIRERGELIKGTTMAGVIAAIGLGLVYLAIAWIGRVIPFEGTPGDGSDLLVAASHLLFGTSGNYVFGIIVLLACLTTVIGLITACSQFFVKLYPKFSYHTYVIVFIFIGFFFTNFGLENLLNIAVPLLVFIYPASIMLITLTLLQPMLGYSRQMYRFSVTVAILFGIYDALGATSIDMKWSEPFLSWIPLFDAGLAWLAPAFVAALIGYMIDRLSNNVKTV